MSRTSSSTCSTACLAPATSLQMLRSIIWRFRSSAPARIGPDRTIETSPLHSVRCRADARSKQTCAAGNTDARFWAIAEAAQICSLFAFEQAAPSRVHKDAPGVLRESPTLPTVASPGEAVISHPRASTLLVSSRPTTSSSVAGVAGHAGGAEAAERRPRGRPSTAGFHQFGPCLRRGSGARLCPIPAARAPSAALLLCCLQDSVAWLAPAASRGAALLE